MGAAVIVNQPTVNPIRDARADITHSSVVATPSVNTVLASIEVPVGKTYKLTEVLAGGTVDNRVDVEVVVRATGAEVVTVKASLYYPAQCMTGKIYATPIDGTTAPGLASDRTTLIRVRSKTATTGSHTAALTAYEV